MLADRVESSMNEQLGMELQSAYVYLAMAGYSESESLPGFASWLRAQAREEVAHGMKFFDFICDRGGRVRLGSLEEPPADYKGPLAVFEEALEHERAVSEAIGRLYSIVVEEKDYASQAWLDWFATEQVEEEKSVGQIVDSLRRIGDRGDALFLLDNDLAARAGA